MRDPRFPYQPVFDVLFARLKRAEDATLVMAELIDDLMWDGVVPCDKLRPLKEFREAIYAERESTSTATSEEKK